MTTSVSKIVLFLIPTFLFFLENHGQHQGDGVDEGGEEGPHHHHLRERPQGSLQAGGHQQEWNHLQDCKLYLF